MSEKTNNEKELLYGRKNEEIGRIKNILEESVVSGKTQNFKRFHKKGYGLLEGHFIIDKGLPNKLKSKLFESTEGEIGPKTYKCIIRFSHGSGKIKADNKRGTFGIAIKLLDIQMPVHEKDLHDDGTSTRLNHDFLLTTNPVLYPGTLKRFRYSMEVLFQKKIIKGIYLALSNISTFITFNLTATKIKSLLTVTYFSGVPYRLNGKAVKWQLKPDSKNNLLIDEKEENPATRLLDNLRHSVNQQEWSFDFGCQFQANEKTEPIENSEIKWNGKFEKIATLIIPKQMLDESSKEAQISFNPWHCSEEHTPLGALSEARRVIYKAMSRIRKNQSMES